MEHPMAEKLDEKELMSFKEMMMANSIQVDAVAQLLIEKGIITEEEFHSKLKEVLREYEGRKARTDHD
jgi:beta-N-acetylglucosaminidase